MRYLFLIVTTVTTVTTVTPSIINFQFFTLSPFLYKASHEVEFLGSRHKHDGKTFTFNHAPRLQSRLGAKASKNYTNYTNSTN